jgi:hypothetical protein
MSNTTQFQIAYEPTFLLETSTTQVTPGAVLPAKKQDIEHTRRLAQKQERKKRQKMDREQRTSMSDLGEYQLTEIAKHLPIGALATFGQSSKKIRTATKQEFRERLKRPKLVQVVDDESHVRQIVIILNYLRNIIMNYKDLRKLDIILIVCCMCRNHILCARESNSQ